MKPAVNQIETHPYFQRESLVKFCQKHGVCVTAHTPIGGAAANTEWFGSVSCLDDPVLKVGSPSIHLGVQSPSFVYRDYFLTDVFDWSGFIVLLSQGLAKKYNKTVAQVVLRWGMQRNTVVIPKSSKIERLKENFQVFDFELSKEDMDLIKSVDRNHRTNQPARFWGINLFA